MVVSNKIISAIHYIILFKKLFLKIVLILVVNLIFRKYNDILLKMKFCVSSQDT